MYPLCSIIPARRSHRSCCPVGRDITYVDAGCPRPHQHFKAKLGYGETRRFVQPRQGGRSQCARDLHSRRARAQSQERRPRPPARPARGDHRPVRLGQIVARLRHHLCRRPAPLCREPVGLCPPVPRDDAEAGRRPDRRPVAGHLDRAEDHLAAIRARPSARSPRSTTTCGCSGRASAFPIRRPPACRSRARPSARWSTACWRCRKARGSICWRRSCAAARASTARNSPSCRRRASSASRSTATSTRSPRRRRSTRSSSTTSTWWSTASWCAPTSRARLADSLETALKLADGLASPIAEFADEKDDKRRDAEAHHLLGEIRLPGVRLHHPRNRAAAVLVQQSVRRLPDLRRARRRAAHRRRPGRARRGASRCATGAIAPWAQVDLALLRARRWRRSARHYTSRLDTSAGTSCRRRCAGRDPATAPATTKITLPLRRRPARLRDQEAVRGRHPQSRAALEGDRERLGARGDRALHDRDALRGLQRLPAEAGGAGGEDRRQAHRRGHRAVDPRRRRIGSTTLPSSSTPSRTRSPGASSRRSASGCASSTMSASTI